MARFPLIAMMILAVVVGPAIVLASAPPVPGAPVLVVAPLSTPGFNTLVTDAGGRMIGPQQAPLARLATSENPEFTARLHDAGAWFVFDGRRLATICGITS